MRLPGLQCFWSQMKRHPSQVGSSVTRSSGLASVILPYRRAAHHLPFLDAFALKHFGGEYVALRIDGDVVHAEKLPGHSAETTVGPDHLAVGTAHDAHLIVAAVDHDKETLVLVG